MKKTVKSPRKSSLTKLLALSFSIGGAGLSSSPVFAANTTWVGNTDANFGTLANWNAVTPAGNTPVFGAAGSFGASLNNDLSGATFNGITFNSGASAYTIAGNSFTLGGNIVNNSTNIQTINNAMALSAARTVTATSGQLVLGGSITGGFSLNLTPTNKITLAGTNTFATTANFAGLIVAAGAGGVDITGSTTLGNGGATNQTGYLSVAAATVTIQSGGSLTINGSTATAPSSAVGQVTTGTGTLLVNGGTLTVGANNGFLIGNGSTGTGVLTISSGTATFNRGTTGSATTSDTRLIMLARDGANTGIINLDGGILATDRQFVRDGSSAAGSGTANFVFGGGTLKALGAQTDWLQSTTATSGGQGGGTVNASALALSSVTTTAVSTIDANSFSVAINSAISGTGGFNITSTSGSGTVTFGGANTYTGATTINAGTLQISGTGDINASSGITINGSGAKLLQTSSTAGTSPITLTQGTLDGTGAVGAVTVGNGTGGIVTNGNGSTSTLTVASLAFNGAGTINLNKADDTFTPALAIDGAFTTTPANGQISLNLLTAPPIWTNGSTYNLISYGSFNGANTNFTLGTISGLGGRQSATLGNTGAGSGFITLAIAGDTPVWTGAANANWTTTAQPSPFNWKLQTAGTGTQFLTNDQVLFNDTGTGTTAINIANASVSPVSVVFNNSSKNYSISSTGGFGIATGSLLKGGTGSLTLNTSNTYSGGTTLNDGTLNINNASAIGTGTLTIAAGTTIDNTSGSAVTLSTNNAQSWNGDFTFGGSNDLNLGTGAVTLGSTVYLTTNGTGTLTVGGVIGGAGFGINKEGSGTLALNGANTFDGGVVINAGTVRIGNAAALGTSTNSLTFGTAAGARLQVNGNAVTVRGIDGDNTATIENSNATNGTLTVNATFGSSFEGTIQDGSAGTLALAKSGSGTLTLTGANTYSGGTTITAGTLSAGNDAAFGTGTVTFAAASGASTVTNSTNVTLANNFASSGTVAGTFTASGGTMVLNGNITGGAGLNLNPTNKITLAGTNTFATTANFAGLIVNGGADGVDITGSTTLGNGGATNQTGYLSVAATTVTIQSGGSLTINGSTNTPPSSAVGQVTTGTGTLLVNGGTLTIGANNGLLLGNGSTGTGVLTISSGTATINRGTTATTGGATADTRMIMMGRDPSSSNSNTGTINLNGGTLATDRQFVRDGSSAGNSGIANFVFGGGTLKALGPQTDWLQSTTASSAGQNQGATGGTVNASALALSSVTATAVSTIDANSFSVAINNDISGAGGFTINSSTGTGTVTFGGANSYSGLTTITAGTLQVGDGGTTGTLGSGAITNNALLVFNHSDPLTVTNAISGTGTVTNAGGAANVLNLDGAQDYAILNANSGTTNVNGAFTTGTATVNANSTTNFTVSQTLAALNIGAGAVVTLGELAPFIGGEPGKRSERRRGAGAKYRHFAPRWLRLAPGPASSAGDNAMSFPGPCKDPGPSGLVADRS